MVEKNDIYDWAIDGIPSEYIFNENDENTYFIPDDERWKHSELEDVLVSNYGRFFDYKTRHFLKPTYGDNHGHKAIKIHKKNKSEQKYAHRLIAEAFISNPNNYPIVRHLNDDPSDNCIENLAWGTQKDNHNDAVLNGRYKPFTDEERQKSIEKSRCPVELTEISTGKKIKYLSINDAARSIGAQESNLWKVINGERLQTLGYTGRRLDKNE